MIKNSVYNESKTCEISRRRSIKTKTNLVSKGVEFSPGREESTGLRWWPEKMLRELLIEDDERSAVPT